MERDFTTLTIRSHRKHKNSSQRQIPYSWRLSITVIPVILLDLLAIPSFLAFSSDSEMENLYEETWWLGLSSGFIAPYKFLIIDIKFVKKALLLWEQWLLYFQIDTINNQIELIKYLVADRKNIRADIWKFRFPQENFITGFKLLYHNPHKGTLIYQCG